MQKVESCRKCRNSSLWFPIGLADGQWHGQSSERLDGAREGVYVTKDYRNEPKLPRQIRRIILCECLTILHDFLEKTNWVSRQT